MQQLAIFHTERISRKGEIKYFQIPLPGKYKKIIAVESSAVRLSDSSAATTGNSSFQFMSASLFMAPTSTDTLQNVEGDGGGGGGGTTSGSTGGTTYNACPNPGKAAIDVVSASSLNGVRTQVFQIGAAVNPGFVYSCGVYSVVVSVTAVDGDTPESIAAKMASAVNATSLATWSQYGSNTRNYKPTGSAAGDLLTLTTDSQHSFFASGTGECWAAAPPPPPPPPPAPLPLMAYDPLFTIANNEKAGTLSLQSPDATDIFFQTETFREDTNIGYGDYTMQTEGTGEWLRGKKRYATDLLITTESPMLEAYYKDSWGVFHGRDIRYALNIIIWYEKEKP